MDPSKRQSGKNATAIMYLDFPSSIVLLPHCPKLPISTTGDREQQFSKVSKSESKEDAVTPYYTEPNNLIRYPGFTNYNGKRLPFRLEQCLEVSWSLTNLFPSSLPIKIKDN